jgi:hypothetical protein
MRQVFSIIFFVAVFFAVPASAQQRDSIPPVKQPSDSTLEKNDKIYSTGNNVPQSVRDSIDKKRRAGYKRATIYSAILPGAGQVYNKKYWKVPIVYAAIGIPAYLFFYNKSWYLKCQYALTVTVNGSTGDSLSNVAPELMPLVKSGDVNGIITSRDEFRKDQDYAALFFLLFYALNIVDATVDAHLKDFNVSSDLSFRIKPMIIPGPSPSAGFTLAFDVHKPRPRALWIK